jgi:CRP/FNR family transcriptional regulator, cyclic AMP receptor protein
VQRTIGDLLAVHPFFAGLIQRDFDLLAQCGRNVSFAAGEHVLREGHAEQTFYVVRHGSVALEVFIPGRGAVVVDTVDEGGIVGVSWLWPPYRSHFDARADSVVRAIELDAVCLRGKCDADPRLGYEFMKRLAGLLLGRMQSACLRIADMYDHVGTG